MEVWRRQFALIVTLVTMALLASADSSALSLFQDTARNKRQSICTIEYSSLPISYCQGAATLSRVAYPGRTDAYVLCDPPNMYTILKCPSELPHFDAISRTCTIDIQLQQCGWTTNPCTSASLATGVYKFACTDNLQKYVSCDHQQIGTYTVQTCTGSQVFNSQIHDCAVDTTLSRCGLTVNPCTGLTGVKVACPLIPTDYLICTSGTYTLHTCLNNGVFNSQIHDCAVDTTLSLCGYAVNPCTGLTGVKVACPLIPTDYLICTSGTYTLHTCLNNGVFDSQIQDCRTHTSSMCGLTVNPCISLTAGNFPCPESTTEYLECSTSSLGHYTIETCGPNGEFSLATKFCTGHVIHGFGYPCTQENVRNGLLYHPYILEPGQINSLNGHLYIQCDEWGGGYLQHCQLGYYYNPASHTCVDGPVISNPGRK